MPALLNHRYAIIQLLGTGQVGRTFFAEDMRATLPSRRWCIIKEYEPQIRTTEGYRLIQEEFRKRAATLARLSREHRYIPAIYHHFTKDGLFYLVREWVQGESLGNWVEQRGPLGEADVRKVLVRILDILEYIHRRRMLHGDIQPHHIILREWDGEPVLINFGEFRDVFAGRFLPRQRGTRLDSVLSAYTPLEQQTGRANAASDLYSLGLTAIYLLTGGLPQDLESMQMGMVRWYRYAGNISPELVNILNRTIQYNWRDRYGNAQKFLKELQAPSPAGKGIPPSRPKPYPVSRPAPRPTPSNPSLTGMQEWFRALLPGSLIGAMIVFAYLLIT
ncbi:MAG: serine/threonine-protein kinase [Leptolyngbyaceae cyanobacterium bins.59]|nr:serine/threonine-protein kinase [Leptolyngbyaceae cyanobacterium bins.59]